MRTVDEDEIQVLDCEAAPMVNLQSSPVTRRVHFQLPSSGEHFHQLPEATDAAVSTVYNCLIMSTKAVLLCRPNSHPFQERTLFLDQPVKVGRSVARARPGPNNGVFDCKVLSRNHALLWYENGKFYLQDTKSSNGTFVNNQRLSKGSEESLAKEVCSGDIVQFGVDVMENSRKVTHGCIIATLKLYLPDGKEAKASPSTAMMPSCPNTIATQEIYQLAQYLQEALHREQMLEGKLNTLQKLVSITEDATESSWKALIDEDRLLTRLEILENQVQSCSKNIGEDRLREEVLQLQEDKDQYQVAAKELLKKLLQEKLEAVKKLQDAERSLINAEDECKNLLETYETAQKELHDLADSYNSRLKEIQELTEKLQEAEAKEKEKSEHESEKKSMEIELLHDEENFAKEQVSIIMDSAIVTTDSEDSPSEAENSVIRSTAVQVNLIENGRLQLNDDLRAKLRDSEKELTESHMKVADLNKMLDRAQVQAVKSMNKVAQLEVQLQEAKTQLENSSCRIKQLQEQIEVLEKELEHVLYESVLSTTTTKPDPKLTIVYDSEVEDPTPTVTLPLPNRSMAQTIATVNGNATVFTDDDQHSLPIIEKDKLTDETSHSTALKSEIEKLKELLAETRENKLHAEKEVVRFKAELEDARNNVKRAADDSNLLRQQLLQAQIQGQERSEVVLRLQDQLKRSDACFRDVQQEVTVLRDRLTKEQQLVNAKQGDIDTLKQQLIEAQRSYKQAHNEAEQLRNKVEGFMGSHAESLTKKQPSSDASPSELQLIREECFTLKGTLLNLEAQLRQTVNEKSKLQEEFSKRDNSLMSTLSSPMNEEQTNELHDELDESKQKLLVAYSEIINLKEKCAAYNEEKTRLRQQLDFEVKNDFQMKAIPWLPVAVAVIGFLAIFYPSLVVITATLDPSLPS